MNSWPEVLLASAMNIFFFTLPDVILGGALDHKKEIDVLMTKEDAE